ncbi:hypothetical protein ACYJA9_001558 [Campylobacter upsaliensis]
MKDFDFLRKANLKARKWALALTNSKQNRALRSKGTDWALGFCFKRGAFSQLIAQVRTLRLRSYFRADLFAR